MNHISEEQLIAYHDARRAAADDSAWDRHSPELQSVSTHLSSCAECRAALEKLETVFSAMDAIPVPDPGENYGQHVWAQISSRLPEYEPTSWRSRWQSFFAPRRLAAVGAFAGVVVAAFLAGHYIWHPKNLPATVVPDQAAVRERILVVAVGDHLSKSEMFLVELSNAQPNSASGKLVNIAAQQRRAEDLLEENRLYRQTALQEGNRLVASTLDELERVLLDVANSPDQVTPVRFASMQKRLADRGILLKVRVIRNGLADRAKIRKPASPAPVQHQNISQLSGKEGSKA